MVNKRRNAIKVKLNSQERKSVNRNSVWESSGILVQVFICSSWTFLCLVDKSKAKGHFLPAHPHGNPWLAGQLGCFSSAQCRMLYHRTLLTLQEGVGGGPSGNAAPGEGLHVDCWQVRTRLYGPGLTRCSREAWNPCIVELWALVSSIVLEGRGISSLRCSSKQEVRGYDRNTCHLPQVFCES